MMNERLIWSEPEEIESESCMTFICESELTGPMRC
jgi:hypothetical protein